MFILYRLADIICRDAKGAQAFIVEPYPNVPFTPSNHVD